MRILLMQVLLNLSLALSVQAVNLRMHKDGKHIQIRTREYKGLKLTSDCFKSKTPNCDALAATLKKNTMSKSKIPLAGHPAARFCLDIEGINRILKDENNKQYDYCLFKDGSMIDAWNLFYSSHKKADSIDN